MRYSILMLLVSLSALSFAQSSSREKKADHLFEAYSYFTAIDQYASMDTLSISAMRNLAWSYLNTQQVEKSAEVFSALVQTGEASLEDIYNYAFALKATGAYDQSALLMEKFSIQSSSDLRAKSYKSESGSLSELLKDEGHYTIANLDINSAEQDFGPAYYMGGVVFASTRENISGIARRYNWNNKPFLDLYTANVLDKQLSSPLPFLPSINKKYHEGPASFTADGNTMAFTQNNYEGKGEDGSIKLKIFFATKSGDGVWSAPIPFKLNSHSYSVGHPFLTANGKRLYFSSDMPGGFGGVDLYRIDQGEDGTWGEQVNLGSAINTEGDEMFPFYAESKQTLWFASNGHFGLGGLDLFVAAVTGDQQYAGVINAGSPLNTRFDDFAMITDQDMRTGFFCSNREGGKGDDDIYSVQLHKPFLSGKIITGQARSKAGETLSGVEVILMDESGVQVSSAITGPDGTYQFSVESNKNFRLQGVKSAYYEGKNTVSTKTEIAKVTADLVLEKIPSFSLYALVTNKKTAEPLPGVRMTIRNNRTNTTEEFTTENGGEYRKSLEAIRVNDQVDYTFTLAKEGFFTKTLNYLETMSQPGQYDVHIKLDFALDPLVDDLSKLVTISPINFDLNKFDIRADAAAELDKIVVIMNQYEDMVVELGSHTDCRGSIKYNEQLSDKRAKASAAYIKERITNPNRIYGKGYGESKLLNNCACEGAEKSTCPEEEHQLNRRTEFKVISTGDDKLNIDNKSTQSFD
ncbi:MAG: OmpA family protein [Bacteroidetes bacterium]|nr:OmpA family protein [Bacteroidota bacterium]